MADPDLPIPKQTHDSLAETYHAFTAYHPESIHRQNRVLDWAQQPEPRRSIHTQSPVKLADYLPITPNPFMDVDDDNPGAARSPLENLFADDTDALHTANLATLSRLLYFTNGITGLFRHPGGEHAFRAAPSAGGLYPTEMYVVSRNYAGLEDGIYNFQVRSHELAPVLSGMDAWPDLKQILFGAAETDEATFAIVLTADVTRSAWRYGERGYRRVLLDTGHVLGNLAMVADAEGFYTQVFGDFNDRGLSDLLFLNPERELPLGVVLLAEKSRDDAFPRRFSAGSPGRGSLGTWDDEAYEVGELARRQHAEGSLDESMARLTPTAVQEPMAAGKRVPLAPESWLGDVLLTILKRRSTRTLQTSEVPLPTLSRVLNFAQEPGAFFVPNGFLRTSVLALSVEGLPAGAYRLTSEGVLVQERDADEDIQFKAWHMGLGQELCRDAAAIVIHHADLSTVVSHMGERGYRYLGLEAGAWGQRANVAAIGEGLGVSGIGGYFDGEACKLLGLPEDQAIVYVTVIGQPDPESL